MNNTFRKKIVFHGKFHAIISTDNFNCSVKLVFNIVHKIDNVVTGIRLCMHRKNLGKPRIIIDNSKAEFITMYRGYRTGTPDVYVQQFKIFSSVSMTMRKRKFLLFSLMTSVTNMLFFNRSIWVARS